MVNAAECTQKSILEAIRQGNFYATQGPEFKTIQYNENRVVVETSEVTYVRLIGQHHNDTGRPINRNYVQRIRTCFTRKEVRSIGFWGRSLYNEEISTKCRTAHWYGEANGSEFCEKQIGKKDFLI